MKVMFQGLGGLVITLALSINLEGRVMAATGLSLALDGVNDYAQCPSSPSLDLGAAAGKRFTLEAFFYVSTNPVGYATLISKPFAYELGLEFASNNQTIAWFTVWKTPDISGKVQIGFTIPLVPGRHHIAATLGNSTNDSALAIFLDGLSVTTSQLWNFPSGIAASASPLMLGGGQTNCFRGWLEEVRLSKIVRYTNDALIGSGGPYRVPASPLTSDTDTVALWHLDEAPGAIKFYDSSGNNNHVVATNGVTTAPSPVFQTAGTLDQTFFPGFGVSSDISPDGVYAMALQTNNQIVIGGQFTSADGMARTNLARLNPDGSVDTNFNVTFGSGIGSSSVNATLVLPNNQLLIAGKFATINGVNSDGLALVNQDGSLDTTFTSPLSSPSDYISTMVRQPDGKLIIFGFFSVISGYFRNGAARLNSNGLVDPSFDASWAGTGLYGLKHALLQPDGKVLCNVSEYDFNSQLWTDLIRLNTDGSRDTSFQPTLADYSNLSSVALQPDGKILLTGYFNTVNGTPRTGAARFLTNGALDVTFNLTNAQGTFYTNGGQISFVSSQTNGNIFLGGIFDFGSRGSVSQLARFLPDGSFDKTFEPVEFYVPNNTVHCLSFLVRGEYSSAVSSPM